jgi:hypothetical protein
MTISLLLCGGTQEPPAISKIVGERGPIARNSQARTVAWAKFRPEAKPDLHKDGRYGL